jgi:hypothetical protein
MHAVDVPLERILTHSRAKTFRACPRKHALAYTLGYRARGTSNALAFGSAVHKALEWYWLLRLAAQIGDSSFTADPFEALEVLHDPFLRAKARVLCAAYFALWDVEAVTVLAVEAAFAFPLVNERGRASSYWYLGGKIDLLVQLADGRIAIVEHKTSGEDTSAGGAYRDRLAMDSQVSIYFEGAKSLGYEADVCIYDVLLKPAQSPLEATPIEQRKYTKATKTTPSHLYASQREHDETPHEYETRIAAVVQSDLARFLPRWEVPRLENERADSMRDLWATAQEILVLENAVHPWPRRNPDACHTHGACEFLPVCRREASLDDGAIYVRVGPHPELQNAEPEGSQSEREG